MIRHTLCLATMSVAVLTAGAVAQTFEINPYSIAGGGSTSTGGGFSMTGTIGQATAAVPPAPSGSGFSLDGGFWPVATDVCSAPGDMNADGVRDGDDIQRFLTCLLTFAGTCSCADVDGNGHLDSTDAALFVSTLLSQ